MKNAVKNVLVLTIITVIAGACLGYVYDLTKEPIAQASMKAKQEAYKAVFPDASSFDLNADADSESMNSVLAANGFTNDEISEVLNASDSSGNILGHVVTVVSKEGYGGEITVSVGIKSDRTVIGIEILDISETAGLGMNANTDAFKSQFAGKNVTSFSYTKNGKSADYEIDAISGATITTNAMTNAVNSALCCIDSIGGGI